MGGSIWSKLPEELEERVFAFLPISQVFKCRLVCKQWNFILTSQSFKELWTNLSPPNPWFLVYRTSEMVAAYEPASSSWFNIPLDQRCWQIQVELMASAGGLLCFVNRNLQNPTLIVCNPLTKSRRVLPEMLQIRYVNAVGMVADISTNSYRILVMGNPETPIEGIERSITELYDSTLGKWIHQCNSKQFWWYDVHIIWHKGVFYCLAKPLIPDDGFDQLMKYDMERREWAELNVNMPLHYIECPSLISCEERLLLAGEIVENGARGNWIWEVRMDSLEAVRIDMMPREVLREIRLPYFQTSQCQGNNNLICFCTSIGWLSMVYHLSEWQLLPDNRACVKMRSEKSLVGKSYDPNLATKV